MCPQPKYDNYVSTHFNQADRLSRKFLQQQYRYNQVNFRLHLPPDKNARLIDLGCGLGHFLRYLRKCGYKNIRGVDASGECIEFCQNQNLPVIKQAIDDFLTAEPLASVEGFIMNDVLEHQTKEEMWRILDLIYSRLTPKGTLLLKIPNMANPILGLDSRYLDITHELGFTPSSIRQTLLMAGFKQVTVVSANIYVGRTLLDYLASLAVKIVNLSWRLLFALYGRKTTTIFSKHLIVVATK